MDIDSPLFLYFVVITIGLSQLLPASTRKVWLFPIANLAFLLLVPATPLAIWPVALLLVSGYVLIRIQILRTGSSALKAMAIAVIVAEFVYFKGYSFLPEIGIKTFPLLAFGMSYALFRIIHMIVDTSASGEFQPRSFVRYFSYVAFFPAFASGPVQFYPDFERELLNRDAVSGRDAADAFLRIVLGYLKCIVASKMVFSLQQVFYLQSISDGKVHLFTATLACIAFTFYLYANFSGYIDVVIGIAILLGVKLPENFLRPFSARNFLDLWSVWHISMSNWFKVYLFNPIVKAFVGRWPDPKLSQWFGVIGYFITFFVMGLWHGTTFAFAIYGLVLGGGASLNKLYQVLMKKLVGKKELASLRNNRAYLAICRGATYSYFSLGLMCFWLGTNDLPAFFKAIGGWWGICESFVIGAVVLATAFEVFDFFVGLGAKRFRSERLEA